MGYHTRDIEKGQYGQFSKIREEFEELEDAFIQKDEILMICEMADLIGAIEGYASKWNLTLDDIKKFSDKTKSAFIEGKRK